MCSIILKKLFALCCRQMCIPSSQAKVCQCSNTYCYGRLAGKRKNLHCKKALQVSELGWHWLSRWTQLFITYLWKLDVAKAYFSSRFFSIFCFALPFYKREYGTELIFFFKNTTKNARFAAKNLQIRSEIGLLDLNCTIYKIVFWNTPEFAKKQKKNIHFCFEKCDFLVTALRCLSETMVQISQKNYYNILRTPLLQKYFLSAPLKHL